MTLRRGGLSVVLLLCACSRGSQPPTAAPVVARPPVTSPSKAGQATRARPAAEPEPSKALPTTEDDDLKTEDREANPYSDTVTLKLSVTPQVKALVTWGAKQIARLAPGSMDTEITRPRGSGPVDLEIKAEGFMPYHTRLYADRSDKVGVRLYRVEEAPGMLGFKRSAEKKK